LICPTREAEYFFRKGWTNNLVGRSLICPTGKSVEWSASPLVKPGDNIECVATIKRAT
jgi:hypothetical protein